MIFGMSNVIKQLGPGFFDEKLVLGPEQYGSGEETDFLIRANKLGITIFTASY